MSRRIDRTGEINFNKHGSKMEIVWYNNCDDILVKFEQGKPIHTNWKAFCKGEVTNVYDKSVCGAGYLGEGEYKSSLNGTKTPQYVTWRNMILRCYDANYQEKHSSYKSCLVDPHWWNFQNFASWYDENIYLIDGDKLNLDKDILVKGNKIYSPETCVFVPSKINSLFTKADVIRGKYPIGVNWDKEKRKYAARCNNGKGKQILIGYYSTIEEAFYVYKKFKEELIKQIAEGYKGKIPIELYDTMIHYQVEITD